MATQDWYPHLRWGEFSGFKHPNALRYECAAMLAYGAKCSVGDQLHPNGQLDKSTYDLIGAAYAEVEAKEAWCDYTTNVADIALLSAAAVAQSKAPGTCVLNLLLEPQAFDTKGQREKLRALFTTYFAQGGSQLQINVVDEEVLQDAYEHPDTHGDLFVRIAGYNDYYVKQSREIQAEILERSRHGIER